MSITIDKFKGILNHKHKPADIVGLDDSISLGYTGDNLTTVIFKTGGSGGSTLATLATLTLEYDISDNLTSITKT